MKEDDKLIAEFEGYEYYGWNDPRHRCPDYRKGYWGKKEALAHSLKLEGSILKTLDYSYNWNSLIRVCIKARNGLGGIQSHIEYSNIYQKGLINLNFDKTYRALVEFIKWYNENNKNKS